MAYRKKDADEIEADEERIADIEVVLCTSGDRGLKALQKRWRLPEKAFPRLVEKARQRILADAQQTSPYRRAFLLRKVQITIQKAIEKGQYGAVATLAAREAELSSGLGNAAALEQQAKDLGPPPDKAEDYLAYCRRALMCNLPNLLADPALSTKERTFLLNDTCAKMGMTHDRARYERDVSKVFEAHKKSVKDAGVKSLAGVEKPPTARRAAPGAATRTPVH